MDVSGLNKVRARGGSHYFENPSGKMIAKECRECGEVVPLEEYRVDKRGLGGRVARCTPCNNRLGREYKRANPEKIKKEWKRYYEENKEAILERSRKRRLEDYEGYRQYYSTYYRDNRERILGHKQKWREDNRDYQNQLVREWEKRNPERVALKHQRRRARKEALPDDLTHEQMTSTLEYFEGGCALTGEKVNIDWDHVIPISLGVGGTIESNMIPLRSDLNKRKSNLNLFEWFDKSKESLNLSQAKFNKLVEFLASKNGMSIDEYRSFYFEQFKNKEEVI